MFRCTDNAPDLLAAIVAIDHQLADARAEAVARAVETGAEEARTNHRFQSRTGATVAGIRGFVTVATQAQTVGVLESASDASVFLNNADPFFDRGADLAEEVFLDELEARLDRVLGD